MLHSNQRDDGYALSQGLAGSQNGLPIGIAKTRVAVDCQKVGGRSLQNFRIAYCTLGKVIAKFQNRVAP